MKLNLEIETASRCKNLNYRIIEPAAAGKRT